MFNILKKNSKINPKIHEKQKTKIQTSTTYVRRHQMRKSKSEYSFNRKVLRIKYSKASKTKKITKKHKPNRPTNLKCHIRKIQMKKSENRLYLELNILRMTFSKISKHQKSRVQRFFKKSCKEVSNEKFRNRLYCELKNNMNGI
jgi:hypothetical protein